MPPGWAAAPAATSSAVLGDADDLDELRGDVATGFEVGKDMVDLCDLRSVSSIASADPIGDGYLHLQETGDNTNIRLVSNGGGGGFAMLAMLQGFTSVALSDLLFPALPPEQRERRGGPSSTEMRPSPPRHASSPGTHGAGADTHEW